MQHIKTLSPTTATTTTTTAGCSTCTRPAHFCGTSGLTAVNAEDPRGRRAVLAGWETNGGTLWHNSTQEEGCIWFNNSFIHPSIHPSIHLSIHPSDYSFIHFVVGLPLLLQAIAFEDVVMKVLTAGGPVANASITPEYVRLHDDKVRDTPLTSDSPPPHPPSLLEPTQPVLAGLLSLTASPGSSTAYSCVAFQ
jgi:hypothetical protein